MFYRVLCQAIPLQKASQESISFTGRHLPGNTALLAACLLILSMPLQRLVLPPPQGPASPVTCVSTQCPAERRHLVMISELNDAYLNG